MAEQWSLNQFVSNVDCTINSIQEESDVLVCLGTEFLWVKSVHLDMLLTSCDINDVFIDQR
jgi:hypothetical protein